MNFISKKINTYREKKELKKSNFGRNHGWYIEYNGEIIGELIDCKFTDMFWDSYKVVPLNNDWKNTVFDEKLWRNCVFKFKNKKYNKYAENAFSGFLTGKLKETKTIEMRMLYFKEL